MAQNDVTIHISVADFRVQELRKVRQALDKLLLAIRDTEIKARYEDLKPTTSQTDAIAQLAEEYELAESTIQRIIWPR